MSLRFLILCNNDFDVIVKIVINENSNYFFVATPKKTTIMFNIIVAAYEDSFVCIEGVILLRVLGQVRARL